jgi:hypothetical protein
MIQLSYFLLDVKYTLISRGIFVLDPQVGLAFIHEIEKSSNYDIWKLKWYRSHQISHSSHLVASQNLFDIFLVGVKGLHEEVKAS